MAAARGQRETEDGREEIANPEEIAENRRLGRRVLAYSLVTASLAAGLFAFAAQPVG